MKTLIAMILLTVALTACDAPYDDPTDYATLDKITACWPDFEATTAEYRKVSTTDADLDAAQRHHDALVAFYKTLPNSAFRSAYKDWAWYWQRSIDEERTQRPGYLPPNSSVEDIDAVFAKAALLKPPDPCRELTAMAVKGDRSGC